MATWVFTSDLHGHAPFYHALERLVADLRPAVVILGGDLGPHGTDPGGYRLQRDFFRGPFTDSARRMHEASPGLELYAIMGNDDWGACRDVFDAGGPGLWRVPHERAFEVGGAGGGGGTGGGGTGGAGGGGRWIAGLSYVPITPFRLKDWERWDTADAPPGERLEGERSIPGGLEPFAFDPARRAPTIEDALAALATQSDPARTVYVLHSPPHDTACDAIAGPRHVGSRAIRRFLERHGPPLSLSGHIHESPRISGRCHDRVGRTLVVNPGQFEGDKQWCAVTFDPDDPAGTLVHTVRGPLRAAPL